MVIKRARPFSKPRTPYTRKSRKRELNFIKGWLPIKIQKFVMGNLEAYNAGNFNFYVKLKTAEPIQIRDNAIEACRRHILRELDSQVGKSNYYFAVVAYPHQVLRENKLSTGPQADRTSTGMQQAFGSVVGNAALLDEDDTIFFVATTEPFVDRVKGILHGVLAKLPGKKKIEVEKAEEIKTK